MGCSSCIRMRVTTPRSAFFIPIPLSRVTIRWFVFDEHSVNDRVRKVFLPISRSRLNRFPIAHGLPFSFAVLSADACLFVSGAIQRFTRMVLVTLVLRSFVGSGVVNALPVLGRVPSSQ